MAYSKIRIKYIYIYIGSGGGDPVDSMLLLFV